MKRTELVIGIMIGLAFFIMAMVRYQVGEPVPASVYTAPFDSSDPAYKFFQINYGEPNRPKMQAAPDDWIKQFGNNERTMLLHTISEMRVVMAEQSKRILAMEKGKDPNGTRK